MIKRTAILTIFMLLILSGCQAQDTGGIGTDDTTAPTMTENPGTPGGSIQSPAPSPGSGGVSGSEKPAPGAGEEDGPLTTEAAKKLAQELCESYWSSFSNSAGYALDRSFWFAQREGNASVIPFSDAAAEDASALPGDIYFYEDTSGTMKPADVAAELVNIMLTTLPDQGETYAVGVQQLTDREGLIAQCADYLLAFTGSRSDKNQLKSYFDTWAGKLPGIDRDMWILAPQYTGPAAAGAGETSWFVMMRQGSLYRMQKDIAFGVYAQTPEVQARVRFHGAWEAYSWFSGVSLHADPAKAQTAEDGRNFYQVDFPGIGSTLELRTYLKTLFSDEIVDTLFSAGFYRDFDGVLYALPQERGIGETTNGSVKIIRENSTRVIYRLEGDVRGPLADAPVRHAVEDYPYELVGDKWVFTEFPWVW